MSNTITIKKLKEEFWANQDFNKFAVQVKPLLKTGAYSDRNYGPNWYYVVGEWVYDNYSNFKITKEAAKIYVDFFIPPKVIKAHTKNQPFFEWLGYKIQWEACSLTDKGYTLWCDNYTKNKGKIEKEKIFHRASTLKEIEKKIIKRDFMHNSIVKRLIPDAQNQ